MFAIAGRCSAVLMTDGVSVSEIWMPTRHGAIVRSTCYGCSVPSVVGTIEKGVVRLEKPIGWQEGQRVLVIALPQGEPLSTLEPPPELLEADARELAPRVDVMERINRGELE